MQIRHSKQRDLIADLIKNTKTHPTADKIYEWAREAEPSISLGTVYRNLKQLVDSGEAITLETSDKSVHYDGDVSCHRHFICRNCGKIIDLFFTVPFPEELEKYGLLVDAEKCVYYGLCAECAAHDGAKTN